LLGNRFSTYDPTTDDLIGHTTELVIRLRKIMFLYLLTVITIIFIPSSWLILNFSTEYRPLILDILDIILTYATNDISNGNFLITIGSPLAVISEMFILAIIIAFVIDYPYIIFQLFMFMSPGLYPYEQRIVKKLTYASTGLFLLGAFFGFQLIPTVTKTLVGIGDLLNYPKLAQFYNLNEVIDFLIWNVVATGIVFTYPILIISLVFTGFLTVEDLEKRRRHVIAALFGITAIITPDPTPISMLVLTLPLLFLYEITINISYKIQTSPDFLAIREKLTNQIQTSKENILEYGSK
jgi:sec-independent protein translocase protein TatC